MLKNKFFLDRNDFFSDVEIEDLRTYQDATDEYVTAVNINFFFHIAMFYNLYIFGDTITLIGVNMSNVAYGDEEIELQYIYVRPFDQNKYLFSSLPINETIKRCLYEILRKEEQKEKRGWLRNHTFSDDDIFADVAEEESEEDVAGV